MQKNIEARDFINLAYDGMESLRLNQEIDSNGEQVDDESEEPREYSVNKTPQLNDTEEVSARKVLDQMIMSTRSNRTKACGMGSKSPIFITHPLPKAFDKEAKFVQFLRQV